MNDRMRFVDLLPDTKEWHDWRRSRITASAAAVVIGRSPYKTRWQLAAEMLGFVKPDDPSLNPLVRHGKEFEDVIRQQLEAAWGDMLMAVCGESIEHPEDIGASFDALDGAGEPVEIKSVHEKTYGDVVLNREHSEAYRLYWHQVQHQLYVAGAPKGRLAFGIEGEPAIVFTILRDETFLAEYVPRALDFLSMVRSGRLPPKDPTRDAFQPSQAEVARAMQLVCQHRAARAVRLALEEQVETQRAAEAAVEAELVRMMGPFAEGLFFGSKVSRSFHRGHVDFKALIHDYVGDLPHLEIERYRKPGSVRVTVTHQDQPLAQDLADAA